MRGTLLKILACLLVICGAMNGDADGAQRTAARKTKGKRPGQDSAYSLEDIMKSPKEYQEREVLFYARFATTANLFKSVNTRFNNNSHVNFAAWQDKELLWTEEGRKNVLPTLYIAKNDPDNLEVLREVEKYQVIAITGSVLNTYAGYPWILVTKLEIIEKPNERLCEQMIEHMQNGNEALKAGHGGAAARHYEQAFQFGMPYEFRAKAYEQAAQAYLLDNKLDRARGYLRQAVEVDRTDPILHLALADVALRMGDAGEALAHCNFALERSGRYPQVYGIKAEANSLLGDYAKAFADLNTAAGTPGITPREKAMISVRRARIYTRAERYPDAARVYAAVSEPGEPLGAESWVHNEIGLFYEKLFLESDDARYLDSAYAAFEEAAKLSRLDASILYNMAEVEFRRQRLAEEPAYNKVMDIIQKVYEIEPDYPAARILEGRILFIEEKYEEAEFRYQSVSAQIGEDPTALLALAEAYMDLCRYGEAAESVARARAMQPWNNRVQALGEFLETVASEMAMAASSQGRTYGDWAGPVRQAQPQSQPRQQYYQQSQPQAQQYYEESYEEEYVEPAPAKPENTGASVKNGRRGIRTFQRVAKNDAKQEEVRPARQESVRPPEQPRQRQQVRPEAAPAPANSLAVGGDSLYGGYRFAANRRGPPAAYGRGMGVSSSGLIDHGGSRYPQDIQASVRPAMPGDNRSARYPKTQVRLPENTSGQSRRQAREEYAPDSRDARNQEKEMEKRDRSGPAVEPLDLGYTPGNDRMIDDYRYAPESESGAFREDFGRDYEWEHGRNNRRDFDRERGVEYEREAEYDEDGYLRFGMIQGVTGAYASMPVMEEEPEAVIAADQVRIPRPFSFKQDDSEVLLADVRSPGPEDRDTPVRNANVYRRLAMGTTRPAEIIERQPVADRLPADTSVMVPPREGAVAKDGTVRRAEVRLPSSSRGVGMTSDYVSGR